MSATLLSLALHTPPGDVFATLPLLLLRDLVLLVISAVCSMTNPYDAELYRQLRSSSMPTVVMRFAGDGRVKALEVLLARHRADVAPLWLSVLNALPETLDPADYACLVPTSPWLPDVDADGDDATGEGTAKAALDVDVIPRAPSSGATTAASAASLVSARQAVAWFCDRARQLDAVAGQLMHALCLAELGIARLCRPRVPQPAAVVTTPDRRSRGDSTTPSPSTAATTAAIATAPPVAVPSSAATPPHKSPQLSGAAAAPSTGDCDDNVEDVPAAVTRPLLRLFEDLRELTTLVYEGDVAVDLGLAQWEGMTLQDKIRAVVQAPAPETIVDKVS